MDEQTKNLILATALSFLVLLFEVSGLPLDLGDVDHRAREDRALLQGAVAAGARGASIIPLTGASSFALAVALAQPQLWLSLGVALTFD